MRIRQNEGMKWKSHSPEETIALGQQLLDYFPEITIICLRGPLGSGKTCLAKGIGERLGIGSHQIKSPTFTTLFEYKGDPMALMHCDFYRLETHEDLDLPWWNELIDNPKQIVVAEWAERIEPHLPVPRLEIECQPVSETERHFILKKIL